MKTKTIFFASHLRILSGQYIVMTLAVFLLCSCGGIQSWLYKDYSVGPLQYDGKANPLLKAVVKDGDAEKKDQGQPAKGGVVERYCADGTVLDQNKQETCRYQRNIAVGDLIAISDEMCVKHIRTIFGNEAAWNIFTGTFTNAFSGAATIVGGEAVKSAFAASAFFFNAERSLVNDVVYKTMLVPAVVQKIDETRNRERDDLIKTKDKPYTEYPLNIALLDVIKYHQTCWFMFGLQKALAEGTQSPRVPDLATLEQQRQLLVLQMDQRTRDLRAQTEWKGKDVNEDQLMKSLKKQLDVLDTLINEAMSKQLSGQVGKVVTTQAAPQSKPVVGEVLSVDTKQGTINLKGDEGKDPYYITNVKSWKGYKDATEIKPGNMVSITYTVVDNKKEASAVEKKADSATPNPTLSPAAPGSNH
jgi:hypothetical protein